VNSRRLAGWVVALLATTLTVTGIAFAASDPSPGGYASLMLHGHPPRTATMHLTLDAGGKYQMTGVGSIDFVHNSFDAQMTIPFMFYSAHVEVRFVNGYFYLGNAGLAGLGGASGKTWMRVNTTPSTLDLTGLSIEMVNPALSFPKSMRDVVTSENGMTIHTFTSSSKAVSLLGGNGSAMNGALRVALAPAGELAGMTLNISTPKAHAGVAMVVDGYNGAVHISAPLAKDVTSPANAKGILQQLLGSLGSGGSLLPSVSKVLAGGSL